MSKLFLAIACLFAVFCYVDMEPTECCNLDTNYLYIRDTENNCKFYYCWSKTYYAYNCSTSKRVPDDHTPGAFNPCSQDRDLANNEECGRSSPLTSTCTADKQQASGTNYKCLSCNCQIDGEGGDPKCCNATGANLDLLRSVDCRGYCYIYRETRSGGIYLQRGCSSDFPNIDVNVNKNCEKQQLYGQDFFWFCGDSDNCNNKHTGEVCPNQ